MSDPATTELASKYDPAAVEAEVYADWLKNDCFTADPATSGEPYSIVIPPPNVTGALHLGHAINNTLQDILIRVHRMRGFNTVWIPGIDHAGIATQAVVEKQLKENENKTRHDVGRECLVKRIWAWKEQYGDRILSQLQRLGCSCDWSRTRFTLDEQCARAVRETFFKLFKDGLVYRGKRLVNWDTHLLTSISDDELYTETVKTSMWSIRYRIVKARGAAVGSSQTAPTHGSAVGFPEFMTVATTRPETMLADTAVAVHSKDSRWNWAIGMSVELPLTGRNIPIIADDILVDPTFGSGVVKVTPAHDPNDYAVYTRHKGTPTEIAIINLMTTDGKVNDADPSWAAYTGLTFAAARKKVVEDLITHGFMTEADIKPHEANVSFSDRSKTAIQPYLSDQWFVKMAPLAEPALEVVRDGTIKFFPERHAQQYLSWLGEKRDWPISRQLWWGHRIPVWTLMVRTDHGSPRSDTEFDAITGDIKALASKCGLHDQVSILVDRNTHSIRLCATQEANDFVTDLTKFCNIGLEPIAISEETTVWFRDDAELTSVANRISKATDSIEQDPDVLDTWFSSALWPHSTLGWPERTADLARWYPTSVLMTGRDIITLWVARMVMMGIYNMGSPSPGTPGEGRGEGDFERKTISGTPKNPHPNPHPEYRERGPEGIPFHHVAINPTILDGKGERMSKSKGNGVDPVDIIDTHGADALRFTLTTMATETQDVRMPVKKDSQGRNTSDKFDLGRNFCTKLWNAARFAMMNIESQTREPSGSAAGDAPAGEELISANPTNPAADPLGSLGLANRWIMSRFNRAVDESNTALATYRFDQYARACYDFFWRDFCDWYVEAVKPAFKDPVRSASTAKVLSTVLDGVLRLMHPMIPFITEKIWWNLHPGTKLILANWPEGGETDQAAEETFGKLQEIIAAIRNVRNEYNIKKMVTVSFAAGGELAAQIQSNREMIETLAVCSINQIAENLPAPANSARAAAAGTDLFVENVIDPQAEKIRIAKQIESLNQKRTALQNRLASPAYTDKAPAHLVQQTRDELAAVEAELAKSSRMLKELK